MAAIDTNVIVRLCMADDPKQYQRALDFVQKNTPVFVCQMCLLELVWVLGSVYQRPKDTIIQALHTLLDNQDICPEAPEVLEAALDRWEMSKADFADCFILESVNTKGQTPLATFDQKLGKLPGAILI